MTSDDASLSLSSSDGGTRSDTPASPNGLPAHNQANVPKSTHDANMPPSGPDAVPKTKICVFCGSSPGYSPAHMEAARALGAALHAHNISLVYGGGTVGLMGEIARSLVALSGPESVHGIIPAPLVKYERGPNSAADEITSGSLPSYETYGRTTVVNDMHTRKLMMAQEVLAGGPGSGFLALSGGYGTLEELMEVVTWNQLGIHNRGVVVLNIEGYWDGLLQWIKGSVEAGFVGKTNEEIIKEAKTPEDAVKALLEYRNAEGRVKLEWGTQ
ncbi:hypothetical protein LZ554_006653 [Drepanopeziza brunnea f. sp. 'monogermtubi']|nr:hypothetical protein LZ554_006653 [Drepanopeziza brunnea f. sp. 'monogermtubi']